MRMEIDIDDSKVKYFVGNATDKLKEHAIKYMVDVATEAERLAVDEKEDEQANVEITANYIFQAAKRIKKISTKKQKMAQKVWIVILTVIADFALFFLGIFYNETTFNNNPNWYWIFAIGLVGSVVAEVVHLYMSVSGKGE